jgi:hypothetical protein
MAILEGVAYWASIKSPNTTYEPVYSINVVLDKATADDFRRKGYTVKDKEEGPTIVIKRKVNGPNGMVRKAPLLLDRSKNDLNCQVGNGSTVKVQYKEWEVTRQGQVYKGLDLQAVQVIDLVSFAKGDGEEFDVEIDDEELDEL